MSNNRIKSFILENWFGIDRILFNKPARKVMEGEKLEKYLLAKACLLSNMAEIYNKSKLNEKKNYNNTKEVMLEGYRRADKAVSISKVISEKSDVVKAISSELVEYSNTTGIPMTESAKYITERRFHAIAIDALLGEVFNENTKEFMTDWAGVITLNAHKVLRDALLETIYGI